jgi:hypothetical protein
MSSDAIYTIFDYMDLYEEECYKTLEYLSLYCGGS